MDVSFFRLSMSAIISSFLCALSAGCFKAEAGKEEDCLVQLYAK